MNIIKLSRPRFWLYLAGPVLLGIGSHVNLFTFYMFCFYLIPANIILYGINDIFDRDTDAINDKKATFEVRVKNSSQSKIVAKYVYLSLLSSIPLFVYGSLYVQFFTALFFILAALYSMPPMRLKSRPFLDSMSNILYILPGLAAYGFIYNSLPPIAFICAGALWTWAMHLYSAIPDIQPDTKAGIHTTATTFGKKRSLFVCAGYWFMCSMFLIHEPILLMLGLLYTTIPLVLVAFGAQEEKIERLYWIFPYFNALVGLSLFLLILFA